MKKRFEDELNELGEKGLLRQLTAQNFKGVNLSSNDYLGLAEDVRVREAAIQAVQLYGTGGTSSRLLAGTFDIHRELEEALAKFFKKDSALAYSSGYHVNTGLLPVLAGVGDIIFIDRLCHASIVDGVKLSEARFATFEHNNLEDLKKQLSERRGKYDRAWVVTEGIFSMDGDKPPLKEMVQLVHQYDALIYLDEAHSVGVVGPDGRGWAAEQGVLNQIDLFVGTLSKSLASQGGYVAANKSIIDLLVSKSRSFIFTTALAPAAAAAGLAALKLLPELEDRRKKLNQLSDQLREQLKDLGFDTCESSSPIIPVMTGDVPSTKLLSDHLLRAGFFVPSIRPPTVPAGKGRVRLSLTVPVIEKGMDGLVTAFSSAPIKPQRNKEKIGK